MVKIGNFTISQSASLQTTQPENQESVSKQSQIAETSHAPTKIESSEDTWQRAGLQQDELLQKSVLNHKLTTQESYGHELEHVEKDKEARDEQGNASLFGTIFLGPLIGTFVGSPIADKSDHKNKKDDLQRMIATENEELTQLQAELDELQDSNFRSTVDWLFGHDGGSEVQDEATVNKTTAKKLKPNFDID